MKRKNENKSIKIVNFKSTELDRINDMKNKIDNKSELASKN